MKIPAGFDRDLTFFQSQTFANQQTVQGSPFQQPQRPQPQQLSGAAGAPVRFIGGAAPAQLGVPPQLRQPAEQPRFAAPGGAAPRPAQFFPQANNAFSVFSPTQLRGA